MTFYTTPVTPGRARVDQTVELEKLRAFTSSGDYHNIQQIEDAIDCAARLRVIAVRLADSVDCLKCGSKALYSYDSIDHANCVYDYRTHCDQCGTQISPVHQKYRGNGIFQPIDPKTKE